MKANTIDVVEVMARAIALNINPHATSPDEIAQAALEAIRSAGYAVVPVATTKAMERAYMKASDGLPRTSSEYARNVWSSMLIAAAEGGE